MILSRSANIGMMPQTNSVLVCGVYEGLLPSSPDDGAACKLPAILQRFATRCYLYLDACGSRHKPTSIKLRGEVNEGRSARYITHRQLIQCRSTCMRMQERLEL